MTSPRLSGTNESLGSAKSSDEFWSWNEQWLRGGAKSEVLDSLGGAALLLDKLQYSLLPEIKARATFIPKEEFALGREDSKHQIEFGQLMLNGNGVHENGELVALKPFDDPEDLKREWAVSQYLNEINDDQLALLPLGVYKDMDGELALMTAYEAGIKSLDSTFWADRTTEPEALRPAVVRRSMELGMRTLGMLHGSRVIHNDAQAKNMAADRNNPRFIDLEDAEIIHEDLIDDPLYIAKTRGDLNAFISSLGQVDENREFIIPLLRDAKVEDQVIKTYARGVRRGRETQDGLFIPHLAKENDEYIRDLLRKQ